MPRLRVFGRSITVGFLFFIPVHGDIFLVLVKDTILGFVLAQYGYCPTKLFCVTCTLVILPSSLLDHFTEHGKLVLQIKGKDNLLSRKFC